MRKCIHLLIMLCLASSGAFAQYVTQSASGKGTVLLPLNGAALNIDIGKTEIAVGANNYSRALQATKPTLWKNTFFGANLSVKNSSGIGNLAKSGDLVPNADLLGFFGFNYNNNAQILANYKTAQVNRIQAIEQVKRKALMVAYQKDVAACFAIALPKISDDTKRDATKTKWEDKITKAVDGIALSKAIKGIEGETDTDLKDFVNKFKSLLEPRQEDYIDKLSKIDMTKEIDADFKTFFDSQTIYRVTPFIFGGLSAQNFSWHTGLNKTSLVKSFTDTTYRNNQLGIGLNMQLNTFWLGVSYALIDGDNFAQLSSKTYTLRTTDTTKNQALVSEKAITGYSGKFARVRSSQLNIDLLKEIKLGDTSRLILNAYYRGVLASADTAKLKNISTIGFGVNFLGNKSKFLGGLYIEWPDINNNIEKSKPIAEQTIRPPLKKLTFGVTTKFSLSSVLSFTNRPRKPD